MVYDVFLSFKTSDQEEVEGVAEYLRDHGLRVFFSPWSIKPGKDWMEALEAGLGASRYCAVFLSGPQMGRWQQIERRLAFIRQQLDSSFQVIPVFLRGLRDSDLPLTFLNLNSWIDLRQERERGLTTLFHALKGTFSEEVVTSTQALKEAVDPYRDLKPYREEDAPAFVVGRDELLVRLEALISVQSFTALVGPSGCGKTSLVHAGLLPRLRKEDDGQIEWIFVTVEPDGDPLSHCCSALTSWLSPEDPSRQAELAFQWEQDIRAGARLSQLVRIVLDALHARRFLLVIDSGEDLLARASRGTSHFLQEIFDPLSPLNVLLLLRSDYYGEALEDPILGPHLPDRAVRMTPMIRDCFEHTVTDLAARGRLSLRPALVTELVNELTKAPAGLSLLQRVLTEIWQRRDKDSGLAYAEIGLLPGVASALTEEALRDSMVDEETARRLFLRLVHLDDKGTATTRLRVFWEEIDPASISLVKVLVEKRVLVVGWDDHERKPTLEAGYDEIVLSWEPLQRWIAEDRDFLLWRQTLRWRRREWEQRLHARELLLLDQPSMAEARVRRSERADDLVTIEKLYIENSEVEYQRNLELEAWHQAQRELEEKRRKWRIRRLKQLAAAVLLAAIGLFGGLWYATNRAVHERSVMLAAEAARLASRKLDLALLLALQASQTSSSAEARGVTLSLTAGNPALRHFLRRPEPSSKKSKRDHPPEEILATAFGPNDLIATGGIGKVALWDAKQGTFRRLLDAGSVPIVGLAFNPDGTLLASGSQTAGFIRLWNVRTFDQLTKLDPIRTDGSTQNLAFSPDGQLLAWSTPSGIHVWDISRGASVRDIPRESPRSWVSGLAFGPSGVLASTTADGRIVLWEVRTGKQRLSMPEAKGSVLGIAFLPEGSTLVSAGDSFQKWNLADGQPIGGPCSLLAGAGDEVFSVAFSRDGQFVASAHFDRKIRLWDVSGEGGCRQFATLSGHSGFIWTLSFGAERPGQRLSLISGGQGSDLILWEADPKAPTFSSSLAGPSPEGDATLAVSQDGSLVAVGDSHGQLTLFDGKTQAELDRRKSRNQRSIDRVLFRQDGRVLATSGPEGTVLLWDVQQGRLELRDLLVVQEQSQEAIQGLAISKDSSWIAASTNTGKLIVWQPDVKNIPVWLESAAYEERILSMAFVTERTFLSRIFPSLARKQKEYLVTGGFDGSLALWDPAEKKGIDTVKAAHSLSITSITARADGLIASGSQDRSVRLWQIDEGLKPEGILFLGSMVSDLAFSPHGLLAAAVGETSRNEVVLWDLKAGIPLGGGFPAPEKIESVSFGPLGQSLFMAGKGISTWWDLRPETWSDRACDMVQRGLSPIEKERYLKPTEKPSACSFKKKDGKP